MWIFLGGARDSETQTGPERSPCQGPSLDAKACKDVCGQSKFGLFWEVLCPPAARSLRCSSDLDSCHHDRYQGAGLPCQLYSGKELR